MRLGIDFGGTKIEVAVIGPDGRIAARERVENPRSYDASIRTVCALVADMQGRFGGICRVGVGLPGSMSAKTGLIRNANSTFLNDRPFRADLAAALGLPVRVANDANCFALSEAVDGAGAGADSVFGVIMGTGCGGGLVIGGRLVEGAGLIAGEFGHTPLPWARPDEHPGPVCWCGRHGCLEAWISGPAVELAYEQVSGRRLPLDRIGALADDGDPQAAQVIAVLVDRTARGLAVVVDIVDPAVIVLGGGVSNLKALAERIQAALPPYVFADRCETRVVRNRHGDSSGVRGAAWLWPEGD